MTNFHRSRSTTCKEESFEKGRGSLQRSGSLFVLDLSSAATTMRARNKAAQQNREING